ncbi:MAG: cyclic nucleotide-binding domain-containing protein [Spirochaetes bacterium]|nr:cyclic nucleotide-binding domain-containing protein [Spirochaetota bacterium]
MFRENDPADVMYMIHKGKVLISKGADSFDEIIQVLGEMAVINEMPRSASGVALEDCLLIKMDRVSFPSCERKAASLQRVHPL